MHTNRGLLLILLAQLFASLMSLTARLLSTGPQRFHALQILFIRQTITAAGCYLWMYLRSTPSAPFGPPEVRWLLIARGLGGFWGVFGLYYSLTYLDLADATVITFLAPIVTGWVCSVMPGLKEPWTKDEAIAGVVSLVGVVAIVRPGAMFGGAVPVEGAGQGGGREVTPEQRLVAVLVALVGVLGASTAYTTIRLIGKRAHPLISVNYFSTWCAIVSLFSLLFIPSVGGFILPQTREQWLLLGGIGLSGFIMQFCLTKGLQLEKAGRGTNMVYSQMIFALIWERLVWGTSPGVWSMVGSALILGSAVWVGVRKQKETKVAPGEDEESQRVGLLAEEQQQQQEEER
jgi:drug/metabolite transporter (DMT)-like permease